MIEKVGAFKRQSAVIPLRAANDGGVEVLLVTNKLRSRWVVPKGNVEPDLTPALSAAKEAWEEAGASGRVLPAKIGSYLYEKKFMLHHVELFLMVDVETQKEWPEQERLRGWFPIREAAEMVCSAELGELLLKLNEVIAENHISSRKGRQAFEREAGMHGMLAAGNC